MATTKKKKIKRRVVQNKQYDTKTNKRISKSNSPRRKMTVKEECYIIPRELEGEEIIYQNHIKHGSLLKVNPTLKEIKKSAYDWNNIKKKYQRVLFQLPYLLNKNFQT